ncbi:unnamed protein product [Cuscuta epithymum]|uniref:Beta-adaptin appendage C-terminal subdomain domain-containing protein n=1 Tax=Cuscuta epithymum TaxID=186058 RepID=A0AAV0D591_9ASTE|nr:unnamed protein product [Cuscuta epithymum]CAH9088993.1 unnamed protein product [Cuscuta epithymum]
MFFENHSHIALDGFMIQFNKNTFGLAAAGQLQTWKSLPDSNEISRDFPGVAINSVDATIEHLATSNILFFIAKRKHANQGVLYLATKIPRGIPFLIELTVVIEIQGLRCAMKN